MSRIVAVLITFLAFVSCEYIPPGPKYRCPKETVLLHPCKCHSESDVGIEVSCENTNLASMSIGLQNLATFQLPIEKLTITKCHIGRLYGSLLYKLLLRVLEISTTPIEVIEEHSFLGVNETLNELYIYNTSLKEFPRKAFQILGNLTVLKINNHSISSLPKEAFAESDLAGRLLKFQLSNGQLNSLPIEALQPLRKLRTLDLHGNRLKDLKRNQFKGLRDVEVLDISHNSIAKIDGSHFADLTKMGWCNVSHNEIADLPRGAFARNSILKWLSLSHNKIRKLDSNSFRGMRFLRRLYLSDNSISDVGRGTFAAITRIGTIDLARNSIKKIDFQMFYQLNFAEIIDVSANNVTEIQKLAFKDLFLTSINLSRNAIDKIEAGAFVNCANMTVLDLSHNRIASLPKSTFDETTYPSDLDLSYNQLTELNQIPLQNMTGIRVLNASHNSIVKIPRHTFPKLYELHTIDLSHNNVSDIFNSVFQTLFSLRFLDLSHNNLSSIKPSTFGTLPTLLELDISYNGLRDMARSALTRLASTRRLKIKGNELKSLFILPISVSHLDLSDNVFEELPVKQWPSMNSLLALDLSGNKLGNGLVKGSLESLLTLQSLNLSNNGISKIPWAALSDLSSLQYVYLQNNNLTELGRAAFGRLPVVFELNLSNNQIRNVSNKAFEGLLQLIVLNLNGNNLTQLPPEAFSGLVSLKYLDLSNNKLEKLDNKTHSLLEDCLSLEKVDLSRNKFSFISRKTFPSNPYVPYRLREIDLSYNSMPLLTYDLVYGTGKVEKLNVSYNAIADIRRGVLGNLTQLRILDLSHNKLEDLVEENEAFRLPRNVEEVYLSNNFLKALPWHHLRNVGRMEVLDVSDNFIQSFGNNFTEMVLNGTRVFFEGNPLNCDCFTRPIRRYMANQRNLDPIYKAITCVQPPYLTDQPLYKIPEERLNCPENVNISKLMEEEPGEYEVTPDFRFRDVQIKGTTIKVRWLVVKNADIADPYVIVQDTKDPQKLLYETTLPYFKRSVEIDAKNNFSAAEDDYSGYQLCVLAKDSKTFVRKLYRDQCRELPKSLSSSGESLSVSVISVVVYLVVCVNL